MTSQFHPYPTKTITGVIKRVIDVEGRFTLFDIDPDRYGMGPQYIGVNARFGGLQQGDRVEVEFFPEWILAASREEDLVALRKEDESFYVAPTIRKYRQMYRFKILGSSGEENQAEKGITESRS